MSKLMRYIKRHEKPFALRVANGKGVIELLFNDGYVTIWSNQPGIYGYEQEIHITRRAWYQLLKDPRLMQVSKMMEGPSFDRYKAERIYARQEQEHLEALRHEKRERKRESARQSQRERYLRAKRRARRRRT